MALDKLVDSTQLDADLTSVANAIRTKGGTSASLAFPAGFVQAIGDIPSGGGGDGIPILKDVVFIDYDGTIVEQYTKAEFLALDSMPANPSHSGLTAQGWNWSLADAKTYVTANGMLVVGQNYKTTDDKTKIYITIPDNLLGRKFCLIFIASVKNGVTIDWGDGNTEVSTGNANADSTHTHTYAASGDYIISLSATSGTYILGSTSSLYGLFGRNSGDGSRPDVMRNCVTKIETSKDVTGINTLGGSGDYSAYFDNCTDIILSKSVQTLGTNRLFVKKLSLRTIIVPEGAQFTGSSNQIMDFSSNVLFCSLPKSCNVYPNLIDNAGNYKLLMCTMPETAENRGRMFYGMSNLQKACIPGTYTAMGANMYRAAETLRSVTIPAFVTSVAQFSVYPMDNIREYHFLPTTPPTLASTSNMFTVNANVKIYVPYSADHSILNAYQTASNWTSFASYIEEEPQ